MEALSPTSTEWSEVSREPAEPDRELRGEFCLDQSTVLVAATKDLYPLPI